MPSDPSGSDFALLTIRIALLEKEDLLEAIPALLVLVRIAEDHKDLLVVLLNLLRAQDDALYR
jgi:hypothetical protein